MARAFGIRRPSTARLWLCSLVLLAATGASAPAASPLTTENPLDPARLMRYLEQICAIGPRPSGSDGMQRQIELLTQHFETTGGMVERQRFRAPNPLGGKVLMTNLVVRYRPELKRRVLLCAHYDTRPLPDRDPDPQARRSGTFIGANDGGSGVAVLMELGHLVPQLTGDIGVDMVMFDGEELVYRERRDPYFIGSTFFAGKYRDRKANYKYEWGVLLDMVGDADLQMLQERQCWLWRDTRPLLKDLWATAARLGVDEFEPRVRRHPIRDDHIPLHDIGKIRVVDLIDMDYPYWHTEQDVPRNCSGRSMAKVGWVVWEWLRRLDASGAGRGGAAP